MELSAMLSLFHKACYAVSATILIAGWGWAIATWGLGLGSAAFFGGLIGIPASVFALEWAFAAERRLWTLAYLGVFWFVLAH
jgi:hypothetical protein